MKKNLIIIMIVLIVITLIVITDYLRWLYVKIDEIHPYLGYFYLLILLVLVIYAVIIPFWRIFTAPAIPSLRLNDLPEDNEELYKYGLLLARNNQYIHLKGKRQSHRKELLTQLNANKDSSSGLSKIIIDEIHQRTHLINAKIKAQALSVFFN